MAHATCHSFADLSCGVYTDHFSHMNTGRLFTRVGIGIWERPLIDAAPALTPEQFAALPADLRDTVTPDGMTAVAAVPGWPPDKPFVSTWANFPRFHPPGNMVLTAPVAALYSFTGLSFTWANKLLILLFVAYAHLAFYVFLTGGKVKSLATPVAFAGAALVYGELVHWSLEGFYEAIVIAPLVISARYLVRRKGIEALLAFSVATTLHFRALFFAPWALYALYLIVRERQWRTWKRGQYAEAAGAAILSATSLAIFAAVWPYLHDLNVYNSISLAGEPVNLPAIKTFAVVIVLLTVVLVYTEAWLDVAVLVWVAVMLLFMHQAYEWEVVSLFAWLGAPIVTKLRNNASLVRDARLVGTLFIAAFVFHNPLIPSWLQRVAS
jgi:hypothetical protein